jgi:leucyl-tRNA synthetase
MSKSKYNGVDPLACMNKYGTDAVRAHILFAAPVMEVLDWDEEKIVGIQRWFHRIRRLVDMAFKTSASLPLSTMNLTNYHSILRSKDKAFLESLNDEEVDILLLIHQTILSLTHTFEQNLYSLNTGVSDLIKLTNGLLAVASKSGHGKPEAGLSATTLPESNAGALIIHYGLTVLLQMLAPVAPAFVEQCWEDLQAGEVKNTEVGASIFDCAWPESILDTSVATALAKRRKTMTCAVQINGKLRFTLDMPVPSPEVIGTTKHRGIRDDFIAEKLLESEQGRYWLTEKYIWGKRKKMIVVQEGKLVNIVF